MAGTGDLQFERAEYPAAPGADLSCAGCKRRIEGSYYQVNGRVCCAECSRRIEAAWGSGSGVLGFLRALGFGLGAAILGALIYFAVEVVTGYEFGLIAIAVGFLVGHAVKKGAKGRGGLGYQLLAVVLTYSAIVTTYIPPIIKGLKEQALKSQNGSATATKAQPSSSTGGVPTATSATAAAGSPTPASQGQSGTGSSATAEAEHVQPLQLFLGLAALFAFACLAPFPAGVRNFMGWIIIAIGLYQAWKINKPARLDVSGPFAVSGKPVGA